MCEGVLGAHQRSLGPRTCTVSVPQAPGNSLGHVVVQVHADCQLLSLSPSSDNSIVVSASDDATVQAFPIKSLSK